LDQDAPLWLFQLLANITKQIEMFQQKLLDQTIHTNTISADQGNKIN